MALFNPPKELNGIPLSARSQYLLYMPISMLMNPSGPDPFGNDGWLSNLLARQQAFQKPSYYAKRMHYVWEEPQSWSKAILGFDLGF